MGVMSLSEKRVMVLSIVDTFGRMLASSRLVVDLEHFKPGWRAVSDRYLMPCEIGAQGEEFPFTIDLQARLDIVGTPEAE